ncbi:actin-like protein arp8 [Coniosporium apollinis]|uniref:Actin-like protein arp8 n=2 Tax=Coniosporium TaxID=2810619 RepID=A0ABQ9NME7_9PEZI|nr:actin-like protein arp8 [Cladosporium sp. JES 115]KAJ9659913.1 actin-like protein arp8 [Coniosporium apollinis]
MPGKRSNRAIARDEGLERTDNNLDLTTWPQVNMINQKNYYTEYLKRDDQYYAYRIQHEEDTNRMVREARDRDRALAHSNLNNGTPAEPGLADEDDIGAVASLQDARDFSKIIVIHPGSQNLRIGFASDALPKTIPMVIARKARENESEEGGGEPKPKRIKLDNKVPAESEKWFGDDWAREYAAMSVELKQTMRNHRIRLMPNSKEMVVHYNKKKVHETITEHNDPHRIEWTELPPDPRRAPDYFIGQEALRIPEKSNPRYKLFWPLRHGWLNEKDYASKNLLLQDFAVILEQAIKQQLGLTRRRDWAQYSCVFVIPDLYDRNYVTSVLEILMRDLGFGRCCFQQESLAATFGAGYSSSCIVDVGAQKTSICCVEEGMCADNSRINLKFGGTDVTETFIKMLLFDHFPYADMNLKRRYDFLLAEELKQKFCTVQEMDITVQLYEFHLRAAGQDTRRYMFKTYDETMLAPMGLFQPTIFDNSEKLAGRRKLFDRSYDIYDGSPNDPRSAAQDAVLQWASGQDPSVSNGTISETPNASLVLSTPSRQQPFQHLNHLAEGEGTPRSSEAGSPGPEDTPQPGRDSPAIGGDERPTISFHDPVVEKIKEAEARDTILPIMPLDNAILTSITQAARGDDRKMREFLGGIMVIGGGSKILGFNNFLEERLRDMTPALSKEIFIGSPPRELDPQVVVWKGASVFGKLSGSGNDSWIGREEWDFFGSRVLMQRCQFLW